MCLVRGHTGCDLISVIEEPSRHASEIPDGLSRAGEVLTAEPSEHSQSDRLGRTTMGRPRAPLRSGPRARRRTIRVKTCGLTGEADGGTLFAGSVPEPAIFFDVMLNRVTFPPCETSP